MHTLRVMGTSVTLREEIRMRAEADLGCRIEYQVCDLETAQRRALLEPQTFDLYDQWFHDLDFVWPVNALQPIDVKRLRAWESVSSLARTGTIENAKRKATGILPSEKLYVQSDRRLSSMPSDTISMVPLTHNAESFVYDLSRLPDSLKGKPESWSWLIDLAWSGHIGLQSDASIGGMDIRLALESAGLVTYRDVSNLTLSEIDASYAALVALKTERRFARFWSDDYEGGKLVKDPSIHIQSIWASSNHDLLESGRPFKVATPQEGYRGWFGGIGMSHATSGATKDLAYDYLNWWLDGWAGAFMAREGFYTFGEAGVKRNLTAEEWAYWYGGQAASCDLFDNQGRAVAKKGSFRPGGSYCDRMGDIAVWASIMNEHNYFVRKWEDFLNLK